MLRLPALPANSAEVQNLAARALIAIATGTGLLLVATGLANELLDAPTRFSRLRLLLGLALPLVAGLARLQLRADPRRASLVVLGGMLLAVWGHMWALGSGVYALSMTAGLLAIVLSGVLCSMAVAGLFAAGHALALLAAFAAERAGQLPGLAALAAQGSVERLLGQLLLTVVALMVALVLARVIRASLGRALLQEERSAELLGIGSDWTWEMDARGHMTAISPSFEPRTGRTVAEFMRGGLPGGPQVVEDEDWRLQRDTMRRGEAFRDRLLTYRCSDGTLLTILASGNPVRDADGRLTGWRGVSRNATPERRAQQAQARTRALLDRLVQMSPDAICVARLADGAILLANPEFLRLAGRAEAEVVGRSALQLGLWRDPETLLRLRDALAADGQVREMRTLVWLPDGRARAMLLAAAAFEWDGDPVTVITTRDQTEIERARAEADAILDHASVGLALVSDGRFERVNPPFEAVFGRRGASLTGQLTDTLFGADEPVAAQVAAAVRGCVPVDLECPARRADGSPLLVRLRARALESGRTLQQGSIWVAEDITERRRAERELADAKQQAEAASQAKSAFLATMSHEIRTPLNGVLGLARLVQDEALPAAQRAAYLHHLQDAAELLAGLVSDVLDLSKIEAGHLQIETIGFDLHEVVRAAFGSFVPLGRERGLELRCTIDPELPRRVRGDPLRVRQILANYLGNALKFTARGEIVLTVCAAGTDRVRLEVRDSGPGIDAAVRAQLFRPFAQGDSSTTRRFGGTGLGLSICRELAERMGGRVGVDSDGESGSRFWAELQLPPDPDAAAAALAHAGGALPLAGLGVLVAEDNAVNRLIVGAMLRQLGAVVHEADDGEQAVALAQRLGAALHVVLMDLHMPVLDGLEAARRLRAQAPTQRLPIYALSAAVLDAERQAASDSGMNGFIAKPVLREELLRALKPWVPGVG